MSLKLKAYKALCYLLYYSGALALIRARNKRKAHLLTYHRIGQPGKDFGSRFLENICVPKEMFERQLRYLHRHYSVIPFWQYLKAREGKAILPSYPAILTFDDGAKDNYLNALPVLMQAGVPATFFVVSDAARGMLPDYYAYYFLWDKLDTERMLQAVNKSLGRGYQEMEDARKAFLALPKAERKRVLMEISNKQDLRYPKGLCAAHFMDWHEIQELHRQGYDVQPHSASHAWLARMPPEEMRAEIRESKAALEQNLDKTCEWFAYPFGWANSFNLEVVEELERQGFKAAVVALDGLNDLQADPFTLRRMNMVPGSLPEFACEVENLRTPLRGLLQRLFGLNKALFAGAMMPNAARRAQWLKRKLAGARGAWLDFGCGNGRVQEIVRHERLKLAGFDLNWRECLAAGERCPGIAQARVEKVPFREGAFDGAFSSEVLEYIRDDAHAVKEMNRALKTGARLYITVPNEGAEKGSFSRWAAEMNEVLMDKRFGLALRKGYTREGLAALFERNGFRLLGCGEDMKGIGRFFTLLFYHLKHLEEFGGAPKPLVKPLRMLYVRLLFLLGWLFALDGLSKGPGLTLLAEFIKERDVQ